MSSEKPTSQEKPDLTEANDAKGTDSANVESTTVELHDQPADSGLDTTGQSGSMSSGILKLFMKFDPFSIGFALLVLAGGIIGYAKKGSEISLISGIIFFILLLGSTYLEGTRRNPYPLIATLFVLYSTMLYRFSLSSGFMPSGLVALLALIMLLRHEYLVYLRRQPAKP